MYYAYILKSLKDGNLYIGYTNDLKRRITEHNNCKVRSTKPRTPFVLKYTELYYSKTDAWTREYNLKKDGRALGQLKRRIKTSLQ